MALPFDAVIFDMDGTLVEQMLDFQAIRAELGIPSEAGILEAIEQMPPADADSARQALLAQELAAARIASLMPDAVETVRNIRTAGMKVALLTRNARPAMEMVLEKFTAAGTEFDLTWSRENGPLKPEPDGIFRACKIFGVVPPRVCCVGDFAYDMQAANAAGAVSVLLDGENSREFHDLADHVIASLDELKPILSIV